MTTHEIRETAGTLTLSLSYDGPERDELGGFRQRYAYVITDGVTEYVANDLRSGVVPGRDATTVDTRGTFGTLLSFLLAAVESYPDGENAGLFPAWVVELAYQHDSELQSLQLAFDPDLSEDVSAAEPPCGCGARHAVHTD